MNRIFFSTLSTAIVLATTLSSCQKKSGYKPKYAQKSEPKEEALTPEQMELRFKTARSQFLNGKVKDALEGLVKLGSRSDVPQPLQNWITMHEGLVHLVAGNTADAQAVFGKLVERNWEPTEPGMEKLGPFFIKAGQLLSAEGPVPSGKAREFDRSNHESFAILCFGFKDWSLKQVEEAESHFRYYSASYIEETKINSIWIGTELETKKLQTLAMNIEAGQSAFNSAMRDLASASTPEEQVKAVSRSKRALESLKYAPKLAQELSEKLAEVEPKALAAIKAAESMAAESAAFDARELPAAKKKRDALVAQLRFEEAKQAILEPDLKSEKAKEEQQLIAKKTAWLATFKEVLTDDLKTKGYAQPISRKSGPPVGAVLKADEQQLYLKTQPPSTMMWNDVSPDSIIAMARSFIPEDLAPFLAAHRKWQLGVYCAFVGKKAEVKALVTEAAEGNEVYKEELPPFLNGTAF